MYSKINFLEGLFAKGVVLSISARVTSLAAPYLMHRIIKFVQASEIDYGEGIWLVSLIIFSKLATSICFAHTSFTFVKISILVYLNFFFQRLVGLKSYNAINGLIYDKTLRYSLIRSKDQSLGQIMNYMQVDANKLLWITYQFSALVSMPAQIILAIIMMYQFIGISFVAGVIVIGLGGVINFYLGKRYMKYNSSFCFIQITL